MLGATSFRFLNVAGDLSSPTDWNDPARDKLWLYNLHYFDDLAADGAAARAHWHRALISRWIAENPPGHGNGWEPYPTSLRIVNWVKWALAGNALPPEATHSLAVQARWLRQRLEFHLLGNHLWANAKALVFAGVFFEGMEADAWRDKGMALLRRELAEQVLPDGGHFERSPMYHAIVLEDLLDLVHLSGCYPGVFAVGDVEHWRTTSMNMLRWLKLMSHPDGGIAFFNDAALGIAPRYSALCDYAGALGMVVPSGNGSAVEPLANSGYVRVEAGPAVLIVDVGEIGPDYLPGHAHADTLSFELSLHGQRVLVNGGTSTYGDGAERRRQRGTSAHNTVTIDGEDSSEVWSAFRVARRARPRDLQWSSSANGHEVACAHDGYRRLPGKPAHLRRWRLTEGELVVEDRISGRHRSAEARFHFHPGITPDSQESSPMEGAAALGSDRRMTWRVEAGEPRLEPTTYHPEFGLRIANRCLMVRLHAGASLVRFRWG